ncbi:MAG: hypothetical protein K5857_10780 [Lachnospiraceae bacterium]|nr:hypothetical protein [Lachnospiraceae bacterium]
MYLLILFGIAWVLSPFFFIPMLISKSGKIKKKDEEIRRLSARLSQTGSTQQTGGIQQPRGTKEAGPLQQAAPQPASAESHTLTLDDIRGHVPKAPVSQQPAMNQQASRPVRTTVQKPREPKVKKKLETGHILFGVGVILIFVAGLIFATSMWSVMSSKMKVATLMLAAAFFIAVAMILERQLKLREASITMFLLGSAFMSLIAIAIGYFAWLGTAFSLGADSRYLVISVSLWILAFTLYFGYTIYETGIFTVIAYIASCPAFALLTRHIFKRGEIALLLTGIYMLTSLILIRKKGAPMLARVSRILSLAFSILSGLMYLAFGFNGYMSLVMIVCVAILLCLAGSVRDEKGRDVYGWLYYIIPIYGAFFVYNTSRVFKVTIPHGDVFCGIVLTTAILFVYRYVSIKGEKRLFNLASLAVLYIGYFIPFAGLMIAMNKGHDGLADITEVLPGLIVILISVLIFAGEYLHRLSIYKKGEEGILARSYMILLGALAFTGIYPLIHIPRYMNIEADRYIGCLIPMIIVCGLMFIVMLLYHYLRVTGRLDRGMIFTERMLCVMFNLSVAIGFLAFIDLNSSFHTSYALNIPLIAAILMYQVHIRLRGSNPEGVITAVMLPFALLKGFDWMIESSNTVFEIYLAAYLCVLIIGLFAYRKLFSRDSEKKIFLIDWSLLAAFTALMMALVSGDSWNIDHLSFRVLIAFAVLALFIALKLKGYARRVALSVMTLLLCGAYAAQDFIEWNPDFEDELIALSIPVFAAVLNFVIFKGKEKIVSYISFGLLSLFFLIEWACIPQVVSDPAMPVVNVKHAIFLLMTVIICLYGGLRGKIRYDILGLAMTALLTFASISNRRGGHLAVAALISIALIVYYYRKRGRQPLSIVPIILLLAAVTDTIDTRVMQYLATGSFDISNGVLVEADRDFTLPCIIWIGVFAIMIALGRFLHKKIVRRASEEFHLAIDWFTILAAFPIIMVADMGNDKLKWSAILLAAIWLFGYYGRVADLLNKPVLTAISVCIALAWWTQPVVRVSELFVTELRIFGFLALVFVVTKVIYKKELEGGLDFMYYASVASVIWQSVSAIRSARLFDVVILGLVLLVMIIVSFERKSRRWFLLSAISLVCIFLYMSRGFWRRIVWPVYVFAIGLILIIFATRNEYRKKHPVPEEEKKKLFDGWGK